MNVRVIYSIGAGALAAALAGILDYAIGGDVSAPFLVMFGLFMAAFYFAMSLGQRRRSTKP